MGRGAKGMLAPLLKLLWGVGGGGGGGGAPAPPGPPSSYAYDYKGSVKKKPILSRQSCFPF